MHHGVEVAAFVLGQGQGVVGACWPGEAQDQHPRDDRRLILRDVLARRDEGAPDPLGRLDRGVPVQATPAAGFRVVLDDVRDVG